MKYLVRNLKGKKKWVRPKKDNILLKLKKT